MVTGDNFYTGVSISRKCGIIYPDEEVHQLLIDSKGNIDEKTMPNLTTMASMKNLNSLLPKTFEPELLSGTDNYEEMRDYSKLCFGIDGSNFQRLVAPLGDNLEEILNREEIAEVLLNCKVYARMKPNQKEKIVNLLQILHRKEDNLVGFCGDGANDCKALKKADVGLSLSVNEASLAAPFFSARVNISSYLDLMLEGRGALECNFQNFKFFLFYCVSQTLAVFFLFLHFIEFSNFGYIWQDIVLVLPLTYLFCLNGPNNKLKSKLPPDSLFKLEVLLSFGVQLIIYLILLVITLIIVRHDPNYRSIDEIYKEQRELIPGLLRSQSGSFQATVK